jgi:hypothetical protein
MALVVAACGGPGDVEDGSREAEWRGRLESAPLTPAPDVEAPQAAPLAPGATGWLRSLKGVGKEFLVGLGHDSEGQLAVALNLAEGAPGDLLDDGQGGLASYLPNTFVVVKYAASGERLWTYQLPGLAEAFAVDSQSNVLIAGRNPAGADYGGGALPAGRFILKLDRDGDFLWSHGLASLGVPADFEPRRMDADRWGNVAVVGNQPHAELYSQAGLLKLEPDGSFGWFHQEPGESYGYGVAADSEGHFYLMGFHRVRTGPEKVHQPYLMRLDAEGRTVWQRRLGTTWGSATGVAVHGNRVVVTGWFTHPLTFRGETYEAKGSWADAMVVAFDREGNERWARAMGWMAMDVSMDYEDGVTVVGRYEDGDDLGTGPMSGVPGVQSNLFLVKLDRVDGALRWVRGFAMSHPWNTDVSGDRYVVSSHATTGACVLGGAQLAEVDFGMGMMAAPMGGRRDTFLGGFGP